jgi:hypothetical protein
VAVSQKSPWPPEAKILLYYILYYTFEQETVIYLEATMTALFKIGQIKRKPVKKKIIENLRLTYRLPFIYYQ